ncbi:MAG TPA: TonB-dependent siderophore receptor [Skermanella sp.]|nr:TonB-dependent siderophore receptor [Skermanella sp.]
MILGTVGLALAGLPHKVQAAVLNIPEQSLADALVAFGRQANVQVLYSPDLVQGVRAPALQGEMSIGQGLETLLGGTGLTWEIDGSNVVLTRPQSGDALTLPPVRVAGQGENATGPVQGYVANRTATGTKTDTPLLEVPQSISVITPQQLEDRNVQAESEAFLYSAGVFSQPFGGNLNQYNNFYRIRGFPTSAGGNFVDGLVSPVNYRYEPFGFERLEILRGPTSVLYGQSDPGGLINRVSKRPTREALRNLEIEYGNFDRKQAALDVGGAIDGEGRFLYRLTGLLRDADGAVDYLYDQKIRDNRQFIAPSFTWNIGEDTSLTVLGSRLADDADQAAAFVEPGYKVSRLRLDQDAGTYFDYEDYSVGYAFEHRFDDSLTFQQNLKKNYLNYDYVSLAQLNDINTPLADGRTIDRYTFGFKEKREDFTVDNRLQKSIDWGITKHTVLLGFDYQRLEDKYSFTTGDAPGLDLLTPDYNQNILEPATLTTTRSTSYNKGLYLQDQMKVDDRWVFTFGLRKDWATTSTEDLLAGGRQTRSDQDLTYRAGLTYLFDNGLAPYFSYAESFLPSTETDFNGNPFEPTTGEQYEAGIKYQPPGFAGNFTAAVFNLTKQNVTSADPENIGFGVQTGEIRSRGVELEATAELTERLKLQAAYTYTNAEITESNDGNEGNTPSLTPKHMASLWMDYELPAAIADGVSIGGGIRYVGSSFAWESTADLPDRETNASYTLFDAAIRYDLGKVNPRFEGARVALNLANIFDKEYQVCYSRFDCQPGVPRTVIGSLSYRW